MRPWRTLFALAAAYNIAFGLWCALWPNAFFELLQLPLPRYPSIWACLGMVVGLYGLAYAYVAWRPDRGDAIAAIGLLGKILGPVGWTMAVWRNELPSTTFPLVLLNDLVWWMPFLAYLVRDSRWRHGAVAWATAAIHAPACLALLLVAPGTEVQPLVEERSAWILEHRGAWAGTWALWAASSMSLFWLFVAWRAHLKTGAIACAIVGLGALFDLTGELVNVVGMTHPGVPWPAVDIGIRGIQWLSSGIANGLYCVGGLIMSAIAWRRGFGGLVGVVGIVMWLVGLTLTVCTIAAYEPGMVITGGAVMALFIPWALVVGSRMRAT